MFDLLPQSPMVNAMKQNRVKRNWLPAGFFRQKKEETDVGGRLYRKDGQEIGDLWPARREKGFCLYTTQQSLYIPNRRKTACLLPDAAPFSLFIGTLPFVSLFCFVFFSLKLGLHLRYTPPPKKTNKQKQQTKPKMDESIKAKSKSINSISHSTGTDWP